MWIGAITVIYMIVVVLILGAIFSVLDSDSIQTIDQKITAQSVTLISHNLKSVDQVANSYYIFCRVKNSTSTMIDYVQVNATFFDKNKQVIGKAMGNTTNLGAGYERTIEIVAMDIDSPDSYELDIEQY